LGTLENRESLKELLPFLDDAPPQKEASLLNSRIPKRLLEAFGSTEPFSPSDSFWITHLEKNSQRRAFAIHAAESSERGTLYFEYSWSK
jgi:hypothetical protein